MAEATETLEQSGGEGAAPEAGQAGQAEGEAPRVEPEKGKPVFREQTIDFKGTPKHFWTIKSAKYVKPSKFSDEDLIEVEFEVKDPSNPEKEPEKVRGFIPLSALRGNDLRAVTEKVNDGVNVIVDRWKNQQRIPQIVNYAKEY